MNNVNYQLALERKKKLLINMAVKTLLICWVFHILQYLNGK